MLKQEVELEGHECLNLSSPMDALSRSESEDLLSEIVDLYRGSKLPHGICPPRRWSG